MSSKGKKDSKWSFFTPNGQPILKANSVKKNAPEKINKIAIEASSEILKNLIGTEINNSSISAMVNDLSKRNGSKYYDN